MHPIERLRWIARAQGESASTIASEAAWTLGELGMTEPAAVLTASRRLVERHPECGPLWWACAQLIAAEDPYEAAGKVSQALVGDAAAVSLARALRREVASSDVVVACVPSDLLRSACNQRRLGGIRLVASYGELRSEIRSFTQGADDVTGYEIEDGEEAFGGASVLCVEPLLASSRGLVVQTGVADVIRMAIDQKVPVWALLAAGRVLPPSIARAAVDLAEAAPPSYGLDLEVVEPAAFAVAVDEEGDSPEVDGALGRVTCPTTPELVPRPAR